MRGLAILARTMTHPRQFNKKHPTRWQYHPRSDHHSKAACWGVLFDVLLHSELLREHVANGKVAFGINHTLIDHTNGRRKNLDLVVCRPSVWDVAPDLPRVKFADLVNDYDLDLTGEDRAALASLPPFYCKPVGITLMAMEAKAAMTEFAKARPRLFDELTSSHLVIHGDTDSAIAVGLALVNSASEFMSPTRNSRPAEGVPMAVSKHDQPRQAQLTIEKIRSLPRREKEGKAGFDAIAAVTLECANDLVTPVTIVTDVDRGAVAASDVLHYSRMVDRITGIYSQRFPKA